MRNESAVSVAVTKEWYDLSGNRVSDASGKQPVAYDLYRTTEDRPEITTRDGLEAILRGLEPVRTDLTLSADNGWSNTVTSLQKQNANGYAIQPAGAGTPRTLTVKNTQTQITVIIRADDLSKAYGQNDPDFTFTTEVQDDDCSVSKPVAGEGGTYTVTVTDGNGNEKQITFTCSREDDHHPRPGDRKGHRHKGLWRSRPVSG